MGNIKIILVDDHPAFRDAMKKFIAKKDHLEVVAEASNGQEFLELIKTLHTDIVLMDVRMAIMNGINTTRKALQYDPNLKIIGLSAFGELEKLVSMAEAGAHGFIQKETVCDNLEIAVKTVLGGKSFFQMNYKKGKSRIIKFNTGKNEKDWEKF